MGPNDFRICHRTYWVSPPELEEVHNWANFPPGIQLLNVVRSEKALKTYRAVVEDGEVVVEV